jgi:hypothetical protein
MNKESQVSLQKRLSAVAERRLGATPNYGLFADTGALGNKLITVCSQQGKDLGFNAMTYIGSYRKRPVVHLGSVFSLQGNKGQMQLLYLWSCMYLLLRAGFKSIYITSLTHSPKIFGAVTEAYESVFPDGSQEAEPQSFHLKIRDMLMASYLKEFNMRARPKIDERFVIEGFRQMADGTTLIPDTADTVPKHRKGVYNEFCLSNIDYRRGDDILQVGRMGITTPFKNARLFKKGGILRLADIYGNIAVYTRGCAMDLMNGRPAYACSFENFSTLILRK